MHFGIKVPGAITSSDPVEVLSPFNNELVGTVETLGEEGVDRALSLSQSLYEDRAQWLSANDRIGILEKAARLMLDRKEELVRVAVSEGGKPWLDSMIEVERAIDGIKNCAECIRSDSGREIPMRLNAASAHRMAVTRKEPIGVVVAVSAFNHPLNLIVHQIGPAIATGCPVIIKPADDTPLSCFLLVNILRDAGLPEEWCLPLLPADLEVAEKLVTDARVGFFSFIGSAKVGWMLKSKLAPGARCALEHGGAAPAIVTNRADLEKTLPLIAKGGFYHAGQVCVSIQRVFVDHRIARTVAIKLGEIANGLAVGDPSSPATEIGPLIRHRECDRVEEWVNEATREGAELIAGGRRINGTQFMPTVLFNPSKNSKVSRLEIFGPVICIYSYNSMDEAIQQSNALPMAFQASVFTQDIDEAMAAYDQFSASAVMVNDHTAFRVDWMPFAGLRESGYGVGGIPYTYEDMQIDKMMVIKSSSL